MPEHPVEDEVVFGKDAWVYCNQHLAAHLTGWCEVSVSDKLGLGIYGISEGKKALAKCEKFALKIIANHQRTSLRSSLLR